MHFFRSDFDLNCMGNFPFVWGIIDLYWMSFSFSEKWIKTNLPYRDVMHVVDREKHTEEKIWLFVGETSLFHLKRDQKPSNWKLEWWTSINFGGEKGRLGQEVNRKKRDLHIQEAVKVVRLKQLIRINLRTLVFEISFYNPVKSRIWYNFPLTEVYTKTIQPLLFLYQDYKFQGFIMIQRRSAILKSPKITLAKILRYVRMEDIRVSHPIIITE